MFPLHHDAIGSVDHLSLASLDEYSVFSQAVVSFGLLIVDLCFLSHIHSSLNDRVEEDEKLFTSESHILQNRGTHATK